MTDKCFDSIVLIIVLFLLFSAVIMLVVFLFLSTEQIDKNEDTECQRLGFDKFYNLGFKNYCVKNGIKTEVESQCGISHCVIVLK